MNMESTWSRFVFIYTAQRMLYETKSLACLIVTLVSLFFCHMFMLPRKCLNIIRLVSSWLASSLLVLQFWFEFEFYGDIMIVMNVRCYI